MVTAVGIKEMNLVNISTSLDLGRYIVNILLYILIEDVSEQRLSQRLLKTVIIFNPNASYLNNLNHLRPSPTRILHKPAWMVHFQVSILEHFYRKIPNSLPIKYYRCVQSLQASHSIHHSLFSTFRTKFALGQTVLNECLLKMTI